MTLLQYCISEKQNDLTTVLYITGADDIATVLCITGADDLTTVLYITEAK